MVKALLFSGGVLYLYMFLRNNAALAQQELIDSVSDPTPEPSVVSVNNIPDAYINTDDFPSKQEYQLIATGNLHGLPRSIYVIRKWTRTDIPKPFVTLEEYYKFDEEQKQQYSFSPYILGSYKWFQVIDLGQGYNIAYTDPYMQATTVGTMLSRSRELASISGNPVRTDAVFSPKGLNIDTPERDYNTTTTGSASQIGATVPLEKYKDFKKVMYEYGIQSFYDLTSYMLDGKEVRQVIIKYISPNVESLINKLKDGIALDVRQMSNIPNVKPPVL